MVKVRLQLTKIGTVKLHLHRDLIGKVKTLIITICPGCGAVRKKTLEERWHSCECGCELDRDTASAVLILRLGHHSLAGARPTRATA